MKNLIRKATALTAVQMLLMTSGAFAQEQIRQDNVVIGKPSTAADKTLKFDTNDGASNPSLSVEKVSKKLKYSQNNFQLGGSSTTDSKSLIFNGDGKSLLYEGTANELQYNGDFLSLGDGTNTEKTLKFNKGASSPQIKWNPTTSKLQFSNNAVDFKDIGAGGGSASTGVNILDNDSFEDPVTTGWTSSGGTFSQQVYTNASENDTKFARFVASGAGQYFESTLKTIPTNFNGGGCQADFKKVNVSANDLFKVEVLDSSLNVLSTGNVKLSTWSKFPTISFVCPTAGSTVKVRVTSLAAGTIEVDRAYLGSNQNIVQSSNAATEWAKYTVKTGYGSTNTKVPYFTNVQENQTGKLISITNNSVSGFIITALKNNVRVDVHFSEGVALSSFNALIHNGTISEFTASTIGSIPATKLLSTGYAGGGNEAQNISASKILQSNETITPVNFTTVNDGTNAKSVMLITATEVSPIGEQAVSPEQASWFIDANIGGQNPNLGIGNVSSYIEIVGTTLDLVNNTSKGSAPVEIACANGFASVGNTCGANNESIGISFVPVLTGLHEVCFDFTWQGSTTNHIEATFQVVETTNTSSAIVTEGGHRAMNGLSPSTQDTNYLNNNVCGTFNISDTSKKTFRLMYEQNQASATASNIQADRSSVLGQTDIRVTVRNLTFGQNRPILNGDGVRTPSVNNTKFASARISPAGVVSNEKSDFINGSCSLANTSQFTCNFTSSFFTAQPNCVVTQNNSSGGTISPVVYVESISSSQLVYKTITSGTYTADAVFLMCHGE